MRATKACKNTLVSLTELRSRSRHIERFLKNPLVVYSSDRGFYLLHPPSGTAKHTKRIHKKNYTKATCYVGASSETNMWKTSCILLPSRPQVRNTDQGECVITWARSCRRCHKPTHKLPAYHVHGQSHNCLTQPRASQSRLETLLPSRPQLRNTDQGECVITWAPSCRRCHKTTHKLTACHVHVKAQLPKTAPSQSVPS